VSYSQDERLALCALLDKTGPDAPTLCAGWNTDDLIQDGTEIAQGATYTPWYEWLGAAGSIDITTMPDVTIGAGDQVFEYVHYGPGKDLVDFYISDSNGTGHSLQTSLGNGDYDGSTSEWIDERPLVGGSFPNLAHYVSDSWTGAEIENNLGAFVYAKATGSQIAVTMTGNDGNMSVPGTLGTTSFTDTYENCQ